MGLKSAIWKLLGKDPEAVVVSFLSGPEPLSPAMLQEVRSLVPDRSILQSPVFPWKVSRAFAPTRLPDLCAISESDWLQPCLRQIRNMPLCVAQHFDMPPAGCSRTTRSWNVIICACAPP